MWAVIMTPSWSNQKSELEALQLHCAMQKLFEAAFRDVYPSEMRLSFFFNDTQHLFINIGHRWLNKISYLILFLFLSFFSFFFTLHTQQTVVEKTAMTPPLSFLPLLEGRI